MAKKNISKIAALALAVASVVPTLSMAVSADLTDNDGTLTGTLYKVVTTTTDEDGIKSTTTTYQTKEPAEADGVTSTTVNIVTAFGTGKTVYVIDGVVTTEKPAEGTAYKTYKTGTSSGTSTGTTTTVTIPSTNKYGTSTVYQGANGVWYPNLENLKDAGTTMYTSMPSNYSSTNCYLDPETGMYYSSNYAGTVYIPVTNSSSSSTVYYANGRYYRSYTEAVNAANGYASLVSTYSTSTTGNYFSHTTGKYYTTYSAAYAASNSNASNIDVLNGAYDYYYYYNGLYGDYYDYYDYYNYYYGYTDPYYYYWINRGDGSSSSSSDSTTATIGKKKGWTSIAKYLKGLKAGSSTTVDMNTETSVPSSVMSAIKGKDVTVKFVLDNGVIFTVNGKDVSTAKTVDLDTNYNTKNISTKLVKAAYKKNKAVSSAQLSIDAGTLGFTSDLTVKFSSKRGGYKAKLYRYNASRNSLQLVDTATISSNGNCTFDKVTKGGDFVIVIY